MWDMTHIHDFFVCVTCLIHMCDMFITSHIWTSHVTHLNKPSSTSSHWYVWPHSFIYVTWPIQIYDTNSKHELKRCHGAEECLKLQVSFWKIAPNHRTLLWRMTCRLTTWRTRTQNRCSTWIILSYSRSFSLSSSYSLTISLSHTHTISSHSHSHCLFLSRSLFLSLPFPLSLSHTPTRPLARYGVASISRLLKIMGLFCRISSLL